MKGYPLLFSPFGIKGLQLRNRVVMAPMGTWYADEEGFVTERLVAYYRERARGGAGLIIVEHTAVALEGRSSGRMLCAYDDKYIPGLAELAEAVHEEEAKIALQLNHVGMTASYEVTGLPAVAPSAVGTSRDGRVPHELSEEEISLRTEYFARAALRAKEAGFDAVELHGAHGYLINQFLSPWTNRRKDRYGGSTEGRCRFAVEVLRKVREFVGEDFPVWFRVDGDEGLGKEGITSEEARRICKILEDAGSDAFHISFGHSEGTIYASAPYYLPQGHLLPYAKAIRDVVSVPVIAVGSISDPDAAEGALREGCADLVALGRALLADPEWPRKADEGRPHRPCILGNRGCSDRRGAPEGEMRCLVRPETGREWKGPLRRAEVRRRVVVVGGGPGGMEAALVAARRGHEVVLLERRELLGGTFRVAARPPCKDRILKFLEYLEREVRDVGVDLRLGVEATSESVLELSPDAVVVATGAKYVLPDLPGVENTVMAVEILEGKVEPEGRLMVVGGEVTGLETADFLSEQGFEVTVVDRKGNLGEDLTGHCRYFLLRRLEEKGVELRPGTEVLGFIPGGVVVRSEGMELRLSGFGTVAVAFGLVPEDGLARELGGRVPLWVVGDAREPRSALEAIHEGYEVGMEV
ncbi:MAG TPA: FAD-dependent oxidoreductase [Candidatus Latescibacteria bacterium]|nr:FAD-dependent oxidoreductase [Candidatus Latescibacterota bacterium]